MKTNRTRVSAVLLTLGITASTAFAGADAQLLALSMPTAKLIAGVQIAQSKNSPFGQYLLTQAAVIAPQLDQLKALTGFDPLTDLTEVVVSAVGEGKGLVVGHGLFQPTRISILAAAGGVQTTVHRGIFVIVAPDGQNAAVAFPDASTVIGGDKADVEAAIDRWLGGIPAPAAGLVSEAITASASAHAWMAVTDIAQLTASPKGQPQSAQPAIAIQNVLGGINQISGSLTFGATEITVRGAAQMRTAQDAQSLADVLRFASMMAMTQKPAGVPNVVPSFAANGNTVSFTASLNEKEAEGLFQAKPKSAPMMRQAAVRQVAFRH